MLLNTIFFSFAWNQNIWLNNSIKYYKDVLLFFLSYYLTAGPLSRTPEKSQPFHFIYWKCFMNLVFAKDCLEIQVRKPRNKCELQQANQTRWKARSSLLGSVKEICSEYLILSLLFLFLFFNLDRIWKTTVSIFSSVLLLCCICTAISGLVDSSYLET